jgi:hypothetical protein
MSALGYLRVQVCGDAKESVFPITESAGSLSEIIRKGVSYVVLDTGIEILQVCDTDQLKKNAVHARKDALLQAQAEEARIGAELSEEKSKPKPNLVIIGELFLQQEENKQRLAMLKSQDSVEVDLLQNVWMVPPGQVVFVEVDHKKLFITWIPLLKPQIVPSGGKSLISLNSEENIERRKSALSQSFKRSPSLLKKGADKLSETQIIPKKELRIEEKDSIQFSDRKSEEESWQVHQSRRSVKQSRRSVSFSSSWTLDRTSGDILISPDRLTATSSSSSYCWVLGSRAFSSGVHAWEVKIHRIESSNLLVGVCIGVPTVAAGYKFKYAYATNASYACHSGNVDYRHVLGISSGDVLYVKLDLDSSKLLLKNTITQNAVQLDGLPEGKSFYPFFNLFRPQSQISVKPLPPPAE